MTGTRTFGLPTPHPLRDWRRNTQPDPEPQETPKT
jgi:hypothetical protein